MILSFSTVGCKVNQIEAFEISELCRQEGHMIVSPGTPCDIAVIASCTVTSAADRDVRRIVRKAAKLNPSLGVIVMGCLPQGSPIPPALPALIGWIGIEDRWYLPEILDSIDPHVLLTRIANSSHEIQFPDLAVIPNRSRGFVSVQSGCNASCSYCIVPLVRGREKSRPIFTVVRQIKSLIDAGHREVVLCGTHLGRWGKDFPEPQSLLDLLKETFKIRSRFRIRLSSIEPEEIDLPLLEFLSEHHGICYHLHIPLQSGSDTVLKRMNRSTTAIKFRNKVAGILNVLDKPALGTDLIVGFPGETDDEFQETLSLVTELHFSYLHIFSYSPRHGTRAVSMQNPVPNKIVKLRSQTMHSLGMKKSKEFRENLIGLEEEICVLGPGKDGKQRGLLSRFVPIIVQGKLPVPGSLCPVKVISLDNQNNTLHGVVIS